MRRGQDAHLPRPEQVDRPRQAPGGRPDGVRFGEVYDVLTFGVAADLVACPLSAQHYMETAQRADSKSRHDVARTMAELSRFETVAPPRLIVPMELDLALRARYGRPLNPRVVPVFGRGVRHTFAWDSPLYQIPAGASIEEPQRTALQQSLRMLLEYAALAGPIDDAYVGDEMYTAFNEYSARYVAAETRLAAGLADEKNRREAVPRFTTATEFIDIIEPLNVAFERAALTRSETSDLESAEGMTALLKELPSRSVIAELRAARPREPRDEV